MTIVNSAFQIDEGFKDPMRLYSATGSGGMTFRASTVAIPLVDCATPCTKGFGVPFLAQESAIHFEQTAVGVGLPTASTEKLLGVSGTGSYTADTQTWIQPVKSQNAAALQTITGQPALLTDAPGLPNLPPWVQQYPTSVTPLNPGELINVIDNAASGQANQLLNPIDGTFITKDVLVVEDRTATFSGTGRWNGQDGYTYEVSVIDRGSASADHISIVIRNGSGGIMLDTSGDLNGGNVTIRY